MVGGRGQKTASRTLNRATDTYRQPGSTYKVLSTYAPGIDSAGLTLATVFNDAPFSPQEFKDAILLAKSAVRMHDMSKWGEAEFEPYRAHWNPTDEEKLRGEDYQNQVDLDYQNAWRHHYENNDHHPKFWYDFENNTPRDMSLDAIIHMLCDWESFDIDSPSRTVKWYINHSIEEHKFMSPQTIAKVEYILYNILFPEEYKKIAKTSDNLAIYRDNK